MRTILSLSLITLLAACGGASTPSTLPGDGLTWDQVLSDIRAQDEMNVPVEIEWEEEEGERRLEVEFFNGDTKIERYFDPATGELLDETYDEYDDADESAAAAELRAALAANPLRLEDAIATAQGAYSADAVREVEFIWRGRVLIEVEVNEESGLRVYFHDPATGEVVPQDEAMDTTAEGEEPGTEGEETMEEEATEE